MNHSFKFILHRNGIWVGTIDIRKKICSKNYNKPLKREKVTFLHFLLPKFRLDWFLWFLVCYFNQSRYFEARIPKMDTCHIYKLTRKRSICNITWKAWFCYIYSGILPQLLFLWVYDIYELHWKVWSSWNIINWGENP